jgi:hypothetical protein
MNSVEACVMVVLVVVQDGSKWDVFQGLTTIHYEFSGAGCDGGDGDGVWCWWLFRMVVSDMFFKA